MRVAQKLKANTPLCIAIALRCSVRLLHDVQHVAGIESPFQHQPVTLFPLMSLNLTKHPYLLIHILDLPYSATHSIPSICLDANFEMPATGCMLQRALHRRCVSVCGNACRDNSKDAG